MCQSPYEGLIGEYRVVVSESLGPWIGSNFLNLGNFGSISASVQQKTSWLGRNLSGEHTTLWGSCFGFVILILQQIPLSFLLLTFFPLCRDSEWHRNCLGRALLGLWNLVKWEDGKNPVWPSNFCMGLLELELKKQLCVLLNTVHLL